jgi:hypothetical protein
MTVDAARWGVPMATLCYLVVTDAQMQGRAGVGRKPRGEQCLARLNALMDQRLAELGA